MLIMIMVMTVMVVMLIMMITVMIMVTITDDDAVLFSATVWDDDDVPAYSLPLRACHNG